MKRFKGIIGFAVGFIIVYAAIHLFKNGGEKLPSFEQFRCDDGRFTVLLPGKPERQNNSIDTAVGKIDLVMYMAGSRKAGCVAGYCDYPQQYINSTDPQKLLEGARDGAVANVNGRLVSETQVDFHSKPARQFVIEVPNKAFVTARVILIGPRLYQLMLIAPTNQGHEEDISRFFDSFTVDGI